ncbi:MAG: transposase [Acidobacteriota bacterium]
MSSWRNEKNWAKTQERCGARLNDGCFVVFIGIMARNPRYLPSPGALVEITQRTIQGRFLLKPSRRLNAVVAGCFARAQKNTGATVHAVAVLSNHFHLLASFDSVEQMASFACQLKTNLSKEIGRLHDWEGSLFAGRYRSVPVSDEPEIQLQRLRYVLSQGAKEGLVLSPKDWPGVHCAGALANDQPLAGIWIDRTSLYRARQRDGDATEASFTEETELRLAPLPCLQELPAVEQRSVVLNVIAAIEAETLERHQEHGTVPLGIDLILSQDPHTRSTRLRASPRPYFHASRRVFAVLMEGFREFISSYRIAAARLKSGDLTASFPGNCFPPRSPFVAAVSS